MRRNGTGPKYYTVGKRGYTYRLSDLNAWINAGGSAPKANGSAVPPISSTPTPEVTMSPPVYTKQTHDHAQIRYKIKHTSMRLLQLNIALRTMAEEIKDLSDLLQFKTQLSAEHQRTYWAKVRAGEIPAPPSSKVNKSAPKKATPVGEEETSLSKLKHEIARWLINAPRDPCEEIAPLIPAPLSMVKRIRTQLVDAGKLAPLDQPTEQ
jgi:hypothetical protein